MSDQNLIFFTGDSMTLHPFGRCGDAGFRRMVDLINTGDLGITNLETCIQHGEDWPAFVAGQGRGTTYFAGPRQCLDDLRAMGFSAVTTANNHAIDFGEGGIVTTLKYLEAAGIAAAGSGRSLTEASRPAYVQTPRSRVALIAACDFGPRGLADLNFPWPVGSMAGDPDAWFPSRPGMNLLRYDAVTYVDRPTIDALRRASSALGWEDAKRVRNQGGGRSEPWVGHGLIGSEVDDDDVFHFMGRRFAVGDEFTFETVPFQEDIDRMCRWVRDARRVADTVIVAIHQQGASRSETEPPDHTRILAHAVVDAGADAFIAHGRGRVGGIEIRDGKPIVYGIPTFINQNNQMRAVPGEQKRRYGLPEDATAAEFIVGRLEREGGGKQTAIGRGINDFRPAVVHGLVFDGDGKFVEIRLYPMEEIIDGPMISRGLPRLLDPTGDLAKRTFEGIVDRMAPFNVTVDIDDEFAVIRPA